MYTSGEGMRQGLDLLVLAGSAEARQIARAAGDAGARVRAWVSEPPRGAEPMPVSTELVDFSDPAALSARMDGVEAVLDASHGFDGAMSRAGYEAARLRDLPFLSFQRPGWELEPGWRSAPDVAAAMPMIAPGARVFSATGWASLPDCAAFPGERLLLRQTARHDRVPPYPFVELVFGDAPFTMEAETALFRALRVDMLICRNLGGGPSRPKLDAARALDIPAILIDRPLLPDGARAVSTVAAAFDWLARL
jgi:precorrin-6A/cobalt-precorrin-6A reductase